MMWVVRGTGARLGLAYDFDRVQHTSTFLAHQLLHHAKAHGRQLPMLDVLFSAFFEHGRDLRRVDELVTLAGQVGLIVAGLGTILGAVNFTSTIVCLRAPGMRCSGCRCSAGRCVMLDDRERELLLEIERGLLIEDPALARSFGAVRRCQPADHPGAAT